MTSQNNLINWFQIFEKQFRLYSYIATELCDFTIGQWIEQPQVTDLNERDWSKKASTLLKGFLCGLDHMHMHNFVHSNLKVGLYFVCYNPIMDISSQIHHNTNDMFANNGTDARQEAII